MNDDDDNCINNINSNNKIRVIKLIIIIKIIIMNKGAAVFEWQCYTLLDRFSNDQCQDVFVWSIDDGCFTLTWLCIESIF